MTQQLCTPSRVYGPYEHFLFLGCSITSVSCNIGWNEQIGQCDIQLVEDTCSAPANHPKIYYDENLQRQETLDPDPGFTFPTIGSPAYLRLGNFEYCGLVQSYTKTNNEGGNPTYNVTLVDPRQILQGAQLILADYAGDIYNTPNTFNIYGFAESFGQKCTLRQILGAYFGSPANAFGTSLFNDNGLQWNLIKETTSRLTSSIPTITGKFSKYGRIIFRGNQAGGYGSMKPDFIDVNIPVNFPNQTPYQNFYFLDLSEIPNAPSYYRIPGTSISILDCISTVCDDAGCDYYIELVPVILGVNVLKIIKVRVVARGSQPALGSIDLFITESGNVISKNVGRELRAEPTTKFLIGGQVESIFQADESLLVEEGVLDQGEQIIIPFWGLDRDGNIIPTDYDVDGKLQFTVPLDSLNALLYEPLNINEALITEYELQAALVGQEAWTCMASAIPTDLGAELQLAGILDPRRVLNALNRVVFPHHLIAPGAAAGPAGVLDFDAIKNESLRLKDLETVYNFVLNYARDFYGKKYIVRVPYTCARIDSESQSTITTESPSDSGWSESTTIIGLDNPDLMDIFKDDSGKIQPFARFDQVKDTTEITNVNEDDYILVEQEIDGQDQSMLFLKAESIYDSYVYEDFVKRFNPHVVIELAIPMLDRLDEDDFHRTKKFAQKFFDIAKGAAGALGLPVVGIPLPDMDGILKRAGNSLLHIGIMKTFKKPDAIAVPIRNNVLTYGPWIAYGPPGTTTVEKDDGLVPWEYGSIADMTSAGTLIANQGLTHMQVVELGNVTIPGYPQLPIGAELRFSGYTALENRSITTNSPSDNGNNRGNWDASTNNPPDTNPNEGDYWIVSVSGNTNLDGNIDWLVGDIAAYVNGRWEKQSKSNGLFMTYALEAWTGSFGPNITNIDISIGESGVTTTYSMRTYTPKFGRFSKNNSERLKEYSTLINNVKKTTRLNILNRTKVINNRRRTEERLFNEKNGAAFGAVEPSPPGVLIGQIIENADGFNSTAVHVIKHNELLSETELYSTKAIMSLDGLLTPISRAGSGGLSPYAAFVNGCVKNVSVLPEPPIDDYTNLELTQTYLHPWVNPGDPKYADALANHNGHDIDILARGTTIPSNLSIPLDEEEGGGYTADYRGFALKGPILIKQWGYDLQGKPIPNDSDFDVAAAQGIFTSSLLKDKFLPGFLRKPETWPVAPLDVRFDRKRGVWVAPQPYRLVRAVLNEDLDEAGSEAEIIDGNDIEDANGVTKQKIVTVYPISSKQKAKQDDIIMAYYDTVACKYRVITVAQSDNKLYIGIAIEDSQNVVGKRYATVRVNTCSDLDGTVENPPTQHTVKLMKHHTTDATNNLKSAFHQHDIHMGDVIVYAKIEELVGSQNVSTYVCLTDYSREHSIVLGKAINRSVAPNFPDFNVSAKFLDGQTYIISVKNKLRQPILEDTCCFIYRHKELNATITPEYWLIQAMFGPICVVSDISFQTVDNPSQGGESPNGGIRTGFSNYLYFAIRDYTIYSEAAYTSNDAVDDRTFLYNYIDIDVDVRYQCCSGSSINNAVVDVNSTTELAFNPMLLTNTCNQSDRWLHNGVAGSLNCDPDAVIFDT